MSSHQTRPLHDAPSEREYAPYYAKYVALIEGDVLGVLRRQLADINSLPGELTERRAGEPYEPGKWSAKEVVGHLVDTERIFAYRALRFARGDRTELPGFDQDEYVRAANFNGRTLADIAAEFAAVREATLRLLDSFGRQEWTRSGPANDSEVSVRALAYIAAGHAAHHFKILRERYPK
ncbi:MAG TPA: DinB family protein [Pyrinomonadaceae bacterium]|nr:DinB family protein [Pyrinomonadaceae bacterium]